MENKTPINRNLQRRILEHVAITYPNPNNPYYPPELEDEFSSHELMANLQYLSDSGYIDLSMSSCAGWKEGMPWTIAHISATTPGVDLIEHDGGVQALIKEIEETISRSNESFEVKQHALSLLRDFAIAGKDELIKRLVSTSVNGSAAKIAELLST